MNKNESIETLAERLTTHIASYETTAGCYVAFSGGVDSALVAKAAVIALGKRAVAVTAVSPSLASGELESAQSLANEIGIRHELIHTTEFSNPSYVRNAQDRCYHCKSELYNQLEVLLKEHPNSLILNGANLDDQGDYRPGMRAAAEHQVRSPLLECQIDKSMVRSLAAFWDLPVWNKPAMPCLSSRVAYGEEVTPERLRMIDQAERFLRNQGFSDLRVRYHKGDLARVEVSLADVPRLAEEPLRSAVTKELESLGFKFVTIDLMGFRSGNLNSLISIDVLRSP